MNLFNLAAKSVQKKEYKGKKDRKVKSTAKYAKNKVMDEERKGKVKGKRRKTNNYLEFV